MSAIAPRREAASRPKRTMWIWLALGILALIMRVTLVPTSDPDTGSFHWCVLCGSLGLSDFIANVILFIPAAVALRFSGLTPWRIVGGLFALSVAIEVAQLWIPGRESALSDVLSNTLGAAVGVGLAAWWRSRRRSLIGVGASVGAALTVIAAGGLALRPHFPPTRYFGQWTAQLGQFDTYRGRVLSASIGATALPSWELPDSRTARAQLDRSDSLVVRAVAGPRPLHLAPLFSIADDREREILLLGVDGADLVFMVSTRAADLRLRQPMLRWPRALAAVSAGDTLSLSAWRTSTGWCLRLNQLARCGMAYRADRLWSLVGPLPGRLLGVEPVIGCLFMALLAFPVGLLAPRRASGWLAIAAMLCGAALLPQLVGLAPLTYLDAAALLASVGAGMIASLPPPVSIAGSGDTLPV